jgi:hypothetical protein
MRYVKDDSKAFFEIDSRSTSTGSAAAGFDSGSLSGVGLGRFFLIQVTDRHFEKRELNF